MKYLLIPLLSVMLIIPAYAEGGHEGGHGGGRSWGGGWIFPALVGGAILYDLSRPQTVYVEQPPVVYVQPTPVYAANPASPANSVWYYCATSNAYYPNVPSCQSPWQLVPVTPAINPPPAVPFPPVAVAPSSTAKPQAQ